MSLTVNANGGSNLPPVSEGTHLAVCNMLVDLGLQTSEVYKNTSRKVLIGWEIPGETIKTEDGEHPRTLSKRYTASLNESANLRQDLAAWRGRDFTSEELEAFDLRNIIGKSCLLNVIHKESNGKTYANISSIMALPKGMEKGVLSGKPTVFDLDSDPLSAVEELPKWIADIVIKSQTYQDKLVAPVVFEESQETDGDLPF